MDANPILTHGVMSFAVVWGIQKLKSSKWFPWIQEGKVWASRAVSIISSIAIGLGIHHTWNPAIANGTLVITGLAWSSISPQLMTCFAQFVTQETGYQMLQGIQASQQILRYIENGMLPQVPPAQKVTLEAGPVANASGNVVPKP